MSSYLYLYRGPAVDGPPNPETMTAWTVWMEKVGPALHNPGAPCGPTRSSVAGDGSASTATDVNGYSVVNAESFAAAQALLDGHPFLTAGDPAYSIDVVELLDM